jgi:hypothetical protein
MLGAMEIVLRGGPLSRHAEDSTPDGPATNAAGSG